MVGGLVQEQHEGPNEKGSEGEERRQNPFSLLGATQKGDCLACYLQTWSDMA